MGICAPLLTSHKLVGKKHYGWFMSNPKQHIKEQKLSFYMTPEHACSYLPGKDARTLFADPGFPMNENIYTALARVGFRRSGRHIYKPQCQHCNACIAVRLPVNKFIMNRNQRRNYRLNKDLKIIKFPAEFNDEHYKLYKRYLAARHPDGGMDNPEAENYIDFLMTDWVTTVFYEFRETEKLASLSSALRNGEKMPKAAEVRGISVKTAIELLNAYRIAKETFSYNLLRQER